MRRHVVWNLLGLTLPLLIAFAAYPLLARFAGLERLGVMSLAWTLVGYLGILDLGTARVMSRRFAVARAAGTVRAEAQVLLRLLAIVALLAGALSIGMLWWLPWGLGRIHISPALVDEAARAVPWLVSAIVPTALTGILGGVLEGHEAFAMSNIVRVIFSAWGYLAPACCALFGAPSLIVMIAAVALGRWMALAASAFVGLRVISHREYVVDAGVGTSTRDRADLGSALREGGWVAISNVVGPLLTMFDRFVLASVTAASAVAYYTVPFDLVSKLLILPIALTTAAFPAMARHAVAQTSDANIKARTTWVWTLATVTPACTVVAAGAYLLLSLWMGIAFAHESQSALRWLALAMLLNGLAHVPFSQLQAHGRARATAMVHLAECPAYAIALWWLVSHYSATGAALAWVLRAGVDLFVLAMLADRDGRQPSFRAREIFVAALPCASAIGVAAVFPSVAWIDGVLLIVLGSLAAFISNRMLIRATGLSWWTVVRDVRTTLLARETRA